jgi:hypothetical protein
MASTIILSDNGASSGSAGLKETGGNDGVLLLQTTTAGGTATTALAIDASQNVGIGITPGYALDVYRASGAASYIVGENGGGCKTAIGVAGDNGSLLGTLTSHPLRFTTVGAEVARIDTSGNLLVGTTSNPDGARFTVAATWPQTPASIQCNRAAGQTAISFLSSGSQVGRIDTTSSATSYITSSDYRLKHDIQPMIGALANIARLKPVTYKWNLDNSESQGFIAHELAEVCPDAVSGEKDAVETYVDEEGNEQTRPVYQGIDTSFLVATLTAAIQEQQAQISSQAAVITTLTERITALEGA